MKLRRITLENVRQFTAPVEVAGIGDGLNVLSEPNEHGKSTLFDAIQALFFKAHGSKDKEVSGLRPYAGGAPEVSVEIETAEGVFVVTKRWFQKPVATVAQGGTLIAQADAAEAWIAEQLGSSNGGPSGLIWVRQGMTDLTGGSSKEKQAALEARRDLMTSVGEEVEAMTGGRRMDLAVERCREDLAVYATPTGRPKAGGPWKAAEDRVDVLEQEHAALSATAEALHNDLAARKRARRDLADLTTPEAAEERRALLEAARASHAAALTHAEAVEKAEHGVAMARLEAQAAEDSLTKLREARTEQAAARDLVSTAEAEAVAVTEALTAATGARDQAEATLETAETARKAADATHARALRAKAARDGADRRAELAKRIAQAEAARSDMETAAADARTGPDAKTLRRIEDLAAAHATAIAARKATAPQVTAHYAAGRAGTILADGAALEDGQPLPLVRATRLAIDGIGDLDIRPGDGARDDAAVEQAEQALRKALEALGLGTLDEARAAAAARAEAEQRAAMAKAVLESHAPEGIDPLRAALARIPEPEEDTEAPDPDAAEAALATARTAESAARVNRDAMRERLAEARTEATRAETLLTSLKDRLTRAADAVARAGDTPEDVLATKLEAAREALQKAEATLADMRRDAPDLASAKAALTRAESVEARARDDISTLEKELVRLEERISQSSGDAVEERLAETAQSLDAARETLARIAHEVAVLIRLQQALETARNEARERYFTPVAKELKPLLHLLWPDAELTWGEESLLPDALVRDGRQESVDFLSGGTQEQIALLVRLAFARMLAASGRVAPVILDDALVFTDDDRIERMFDALHRQAGDLQILVLTCRQRAFRNLGGNALRLTGAG